MFNRLIAGLPSSFLLSSSLALVACAGTDSVEDQASPTTVLAHESGDDGAHHDPVKTVADGGVTTVPPPRGCGPNTFDAIQAQIFDSPKYGCTQAGCHGQVNSGLDLRAEVAYAGLLGLPITPTEGEDHDHAHDEAAAEDHDHAQEEGTHTHAHLVPGNPEASVLYDRLRAGVQGGQPALGGLAMPLGKPAITRELLDAVGAWIRAGAPKTGFVAGTEKALCKSADAGTVR